MRGKSTVSQRIVKMGQRQARYQEAPQVNFGSPRTSLCPHYLEQPGPRLCCHYQHYPQVYPERVLSYSPPYSPSLFKRPPERR
uniref:Uncharacterized protein n=1 Tax=Knipowitschia caucasica TaxID=637954 RepID=A0AAV2MKI6_KNICA